MIGQTTTHATLVARLSAGEDAEAWSLFEARYSDLLRSFARRRGLQPNDCEDLVQDVMLALRRSMPGFTYDPQRGRFRGYLKTIAMRAISRRLCQNRAAVGQSGVESAQSDRLDDPAAEEHWEAEWRQYHLRIAMQTVRAEFNETDLAAFDAYAGRGGDAEEVAAALGMSVDAVYQAKSRVLRRLRSVIAAQVAEEG